MTTARTYDLIYGYLVADTYTKINVPAPIAPMSASDSAYFRIAISGVGFDSLSLNGHSYCSIVKVG